MIITLTRDEAQQVLDALEGVFEGDGKGAECWTVNGGTFEAVYCMNAMRLLRARLAQPEPDYRDVVIKGDLWRIEFLPDHAASVVLVKANYEAQPEQRTGGCLLTGVCAAEGHRIQKAQREWQGLTTAEVKVLWNATKKPGEFAAFLEARLKEKNA
jgi:hypothetical protein